MKQIVSIFHRIMATLGEGRHDSGRRVAQQLPRAAPPTGSGRAANARHPLRSVRRWSASVIRSLANGWQKKSGGHRPAAE